MARLGKRVYKKALFPLHPDLVETFSDMGHDDSE